MKQYPALKSSYFVPKSIGAVVNKRHDSNMTHAKNVHALIILRMPVPSFVPRLGDSPLGWSATIDADRC